MGDLGGEQTFFWNTLEHAIVAAVVYQQMFTEAKKFLLRYGALRDVHWPGRNQLAGRQTR